MYCHKKAPQANIDIDIAAQVNRNEQGRFLMRIADSGFSGILVSSVLGLLKAQGRLDW
jgi:hypothetical protein